MELSSEKLRWSWGNWGGSGAKLSKKVEPQSPFLRVADPALLFHFPLFASPLLLGRKALNREAIGIKRVSDQDGGYQPLVLCLPALVY